MITILVEDLEIECIIGLLDFERKIPQKICINAKFRADEFVDYSYVCEVLKDSFENEKFLKVEDGLNFFAKKFKENFKSLGYFYMKIMKPNIILDANVGAEIEMIY
ncbi:dihydroneopterin aldolase [Campylobacter sp. FMV-PI01]|uniref:Dihydroneopterin aldolase n=1 Tax=Campylobacter portucalensis TaxID=2608384 RepID=A0A6L5WJG7_9BACT|nr:dihydroneopterin aldolase [Campylobacter portucalensis]MSN96165.1 dihydroneopterin aldolase [Campylobacter portucalensis]